MTDHPFSNPTFSTTTDTTIPTSKCQIRGCKVKGAQQYNCAAENCNKKVHLLCYQGIVLRDKNGAEEAPLPDNLVACTKACYKAISKALSGGSDSKRGNWNNDGKGGIDDPHTSMKILLDWFTTEGNYSRFCGKDNNGVKKLQYCSMLAEKTKTETSSDSRNPKQVLDRIKRLCDIFVSEKGIVVSGRS